MKTVLLAIAGETPNRKALHYAVELCREMKARLSVLQVINPSRKNRTSQFIADCAEKIRSTIEETMTAIAFSEVGEPPPFKNKSAEATFAKGRVADRKKSGEILEELIVKRGKASREIVGYIKKNRDIVLTVYDPEMESDTQKKKQRRTMPDSIKKNIDIPIVTVQR
jgi:hypothetical protein